MLPLVTIEGRVVADPELRFATSGVAVGRMRLVASKQKKNDAGEWVDDKTLWINCTMFKTLAENVAESIVKGDLVTVVGRLQTDEWTDKDSGEKRSQTVVIADSVAASLQFRTIKHGDQRAERSGGQGRQGGQGGQQAHDDPWATGPSGGSGFNDDPPF